MPFSNTHQQSFDRRTLLDSLYPWTSMGTPWTDILLIIHSLTFAAFHAAYPTISRI